MLYFSIEHFGNGGVNVGRGGEGVANVRRYARPIDHHRDVPQFLINRDRRLAPQVAAVHIGIAQVVTVIGA
ncbi:unannotated protein [freshwater metagenome]|uniref:Unannotated protein n=1 Tax=freshwater metagenome TaxID=449393 RepID=A0A6J6L2F6_9ZZZZ